MELKPFEYTAENADRCAGGQVVMYRLGKPVTSRLSRTELAEYEAAKKRHFVIARYGARVSDAYCLWCAGSNVPFVHLQPKRVYAAVTLDAIFLRPRAAIPTASTSPATC